MNSPVPKEVAITNFIHVLLEAVEVACAIIAAAAALGMGALVVADALGAFDHIPTCPF